MSKRHKGACVEKAEYWNSKASVYDKESEFCSSFDEDTSGHVRRALLAGKVTSCPSSSILHASCTISWCCLEVFGSAL